MVLPLCALRQRSVQGLKGRRSIHALWTPSPEQLHPTALNAVAWSYSQQRQTLNEGPCICTVPCNSSHCHVAVSRRHFSAAAAVAAVEAPATTTYKFKSAAHRDMVVLSTRLHLQDLLLQRFGRLRTAECCVLRKATGTPRLLLLWAELLVEQDPARPPASAYVVPPELYQLPEVKDLLREDGELRWLMQRIDPKGKGGMCDSSKDGVPVPHFPSVLQQDVPRFPYEPQQLEFLRDTYGLLKWPFKPLRGAAAAAVAAATTGSGPIQPITEAEPTVEGTSGAVAAAAAAVDRGDVKRANSQVLTQCSTDAIYAPDETETGAYVWH
ncbi:hypothetical protein, conserved [Eimeria tenella]|uniref:Uncharacterized protein n=1 Tax=Eimeria tenella TaxID=5802 RepID=U6KPB7_EIMTE|nr:hypothetical protein, conserved [Eimeria tenella]CDJ38132.1 hypothetical protein, conserved [Eimeria tenella]|eukprot:XP_013228970.1 hypothetical protein, conserved [Eimeria tenella]